MLTDGCKQRGKRGARFQAHADGKLAIKIAAVDGRIMHIVDAVAALRKILFHRAQQAGLARTGISRHDRRGATFQRGLQTLTRSLQAFGIQHLGCRDIFAEWRPRQRVGR